LKKIEFDIDLDVGNRDNILKFIEHIPASSLKTGELVRHNTGVYVQNIPYEPVSGCASYDYLEAEDLGYLKIDFLNMSVYEMIRDEDHLNQLMNKEPNWKKLMDRNFCSKIVHIGNHYRLIVEMKPSSIKEMSMILALIRPGKKHLVGKSWSEIEKEVWIKTDEYSFKKSHSIGYSVLVAVHMNVLEEQGF
jgi:DNA polymerase III alpha subunit